MEFLFELLKEIARAVVRELSAYALRKQFEKKRQQKTRASPTKVQAWV
ncbi:conserved hypothetical protein (plasmid) [Bacillus cereus Q1]|uniref:Uncharacterized protein n=1 Tax=Bacillus cereus (strain Q1) TaxID=361100 RepID=B9J602_BACCQ|nr:hypothetical protein [Bacillus paranthracis]ACM15797.1 conserved hypothetical protein [Bacillus cereus Q1]MED1611539.1 hypothetical protein [Bacillus paranthracis]MED1684686.1 hypothetical protein [Bacillus paranthracis]